VEWSEEDKEMLKSIIEDVTPVGECPDYPTDEEHEYYYSGQDKTNWLKDLPNRFNLQPKSEWSKEDSEALDMCLDAIPKVWKTKSGKLLTAGWLKTIFKSFCPQSNTMSIKDVIKFGNLEYEEGLNHHWNPSDEQMDCLKETIIQTKGYQYSWCLPELYEQLEKLKDKTDVLKKES